MNIDNSLVEFHYAGKQTEIEGNERSLRDFFFLKMREVSIRLYAYVGDQVERENGWCQSKKEKGLEQSS